MLQNLVKIGTPSFFPFTANIAGGTGAACSQGIVNGVYNGQHKYVPFVPNGINWTASQGQDVISAHFSGCIMAAYTEGGVAKVAHVSTGDFGDCKAEWDRIKARSTNVFEFKPSDFVGDTAHERCYGLITSDLKVYTILVGTSQATMPNGERTRSDPKFLKIEMARLLR